MHYRLHTTAHIILPFCPNHMHDPRPGVRELYAVSSFVVFSQQKQQHKAV